MEIGFSDCETEVLSDSFVEMNDDLPIVVRDILRVSLGSFYYLFGNFVEFFSVTSFAEVIYLSFLDKPGLYIDLFSLFPSNLIELGSNFVVSTFNFLVATA